MADLDGLLAIGVGIAAVVAALSLDMFGGGDSGNVQQRVVKPVKIVEKVIKPAQDAVNQASGGSGGSTSGGGGGSMDPVEAVKTAQDEFGTGVSTAASQDKDVAEVVRQAEAESDSVNVGGVQTTTGQNVTKETEDIFGSV